MYLALKPGVRCGWAAWSPGDARPACGSFDMPLELGRAGCRMHAWLHELAQVHPYEVLIYEQPTGPTETLGDKHLAEIAMTFGIASHIESYCHHRGIRCRRAGLGAWRRTFLGKGVGEKVRTFDGWMKARLQEFGWWRPKRREEQSAVGLLDHLIALEARHTPPWRERELQDLQAPAVAAGGAG